MCDIKHCKQKDIELEYYGFEICRKHWLLHCDDKINLKELLGMKTEPIEQKIIVGEGQTKLNF